MPQETVELTGHIIDSLTLPKVLDAIIEMGGEFDIEQIDIGRRRADASSARVAIRTATQEQMDRLLGRLGDLGASLVNESDAQLAPAPADGVFPDDFYATTNLPTHVRLGGAWVAVERPEMDKGVRVTPARDAARLSSPKSARTVPMANVRKGDLLVVGHGGVRVQPTPRSATESGFSFMSSAVSTEKPKLVQTRAVADLIRRTRDGGRKVLLVGGPAIIHTGSGPHLERMIEAGFIDVLFAGNALAAHDLEQAIFGTSLGVNLARGQVVQHGHQHHLRAINMIRKAGGIAAAIDQGLVAGGVMHACHRRGVKVVLAGSIRDDGPLPEVVTDMPAAQDAMRAAIEGVGLALMIATTLHSVATGNMLPASVTTIVVDINANVVTKLLDRGSLQTIGVVTDVEPLLRELARELCPVEEPA